VPLSWVLGAAAFALVLALLVAWVARAPAPPDIARPADAHGPTERSAALGTAIPALQSALPSPQATAQNVASPQGAAVVTVNNSAPTPKAAPVLSALHPVDPAPVAVPSAHAAQAPGARPVDLHATAASSADPGAKPHQSIY
jgi:hypothetical protein